MEIVVAAGVVFVFLVSLLLMLYKISKIYASDIRFYKSNDWDFSQDSENIIRWGRFQSNPKMSGQAKVYFGYPAFLVALSAAFMFTIAVVIDFALS